MESSTTNVLMDFAPVIPSLKLLVMVLLISRILRFSTTSFFWNRAMTITAIGTKQNNIQCKFYVDHDHIDEDKDQIGSVPDNVHHAPGYHFTDLASITHDSGMDIADVILIEVGKGQFLQMVERRTAQISVHIHFNHAGPVDTDEVDDDLNNQNAKIQ
jgi:hypothetical protein